MSWEFEAFTGVSVLLSIGAAWTHLVVKLDRLQRGQHLQRLCQKRIRVRLAAVERWLPPRDTSPP